MEAGTQPAIYNPAPVGTDSPVLGTLVFSLRCVLALLSLLAFSVMAANKETIYSYYRGVYTTTYYRYTVNFSAVKAFVGLLSVAVIVCAYAIVQVVLSLVKAASTGAFVSSPTTSGNMITFVCDLVLSYALVAAGGAAADSQYILHDAGLCDDYNKFCPKATASIAFSFLAFAILAVLTALYPVRLLRMSK